MQGKNECVMSKPEIIPEVKLRLGRLVARTVSNYFKDPAHRAEYEKWHLETYGEPYVWKYTTITESDLESLYEEPNEND